MRRTSMKIKEMIWCRDAEDVDDAARIMESREVRRLPVINEHKRMVGMPGIGDVPHAASSGTTSR